MTGRPRWPAVTIFAAVVVAAAAGARGRATAAGRVAIACDVLALSADHVPIAGLAQGDFEVLADGALVPVTRFSPTPAEVSVVMLIDGTASQPLKRYEILAAVQTGFIPSLLPGDRARLAALGSPVVFGSWMGADRAAASGSARALLDRLPLEPSPIWDAIDAAATVLADAPGPRVILLVSDGRSTANALGLDEAARRAIAAGVSISVVSEGGEWLIPQFGDAPDRARSDLSLRWLADMTGGMFLEDGTARRTLKPQMNAFAYVRELVSTPSKPAPLVAAIMTALRARYRLGFEVDADGRAHALEVRIRRPGTEIRAPRSFVAR